MSFHPDLYNSFLGINDKTTDVGIIVAYGRIAFGWYCPYSRVEVIDTYIRVPKERKDRFLQSRIPFSQRLPLKLPGFSETQAHAYMLWERRGRPFGSSRTDWFQAERELSKPWIPEDGIVRLARDILEIRRRFRQKEDHDLNEKLNMLFDKGLLRDQNVSMTAKSFAALYHCSR